MQFNLFAPSDNNKPVEESVQVICNFNCELWYSKFLELKTWESNEWEIIELASKAHLIPHPGVNPGCDPEILRDSHVITAFNG